MLDRAILRPIRRLSSQQRAIDVEKTIQGSLSSASASGVGVVAVVALSNNYRDALIVSVDHRFRSQAFSNAVGGLKSSVLFQAPR